MIFFITLTLVEIELAIQDDLSLLVVAWEIWDVCLSWLLDLSHFCESYLTIALLALVLTVVHFLVLVCVAFVLN